MATTGTSDYAARRVPVSMEEVQADPLFLHHLADIHNAKQHLDLLPDDRPKAIVGYYYSSIHKCFLVSTAVPGNPVNIGKLAFTDNRIIPPLYFKKIYRSYAKHFLIVNRKRFRTREAEELQSTFIDLMDFFVLPITGLLKKNSHLVISMDINIEGNPCFVELSHLFNLRYRFGHNIEGEDILITNVTGYSAEQHVSSLASLALPGISSMNVLCGLTLVDYPVPTDLKKHVRVKTYKTILETVNQNGGNASYFTSLEQLLTLCEKGMEKSIIQVISHFETIGKLGYLFTINGTIRFDEIVKKIRLLKNSGCLRDDIVLDGKTCANFHPFRSLYDQGIKLIYLSRLDLEINLIAYLLYELYSCHNAKRLGIDTPYIDGKSYLHEAWAKVYRTLYRLMYEGKELEIP